MRSVSARRIRSPLVGPNISAYAARLMRCGIYFFSLEERAHDRAAETKHHSAAAIRYEVNFAFLTGLEPHGRTGRNVQTLSARFVTVKHECRIGFVKMVMTAHLDWPVSRIGNNYSGARKIRIELNVAIRGENLARNHDSPHGLVDGDELGPVRKSRLDLNFGKHFGNS